MQRFQKTEEERLATKVAINEFNLNMRKRFKDFTKKDWAKTSNRMKWTQSNSTINDTNTLNIIPNTVSIKTRFKNSKVILEDNLIKSNNKEIKVINLKSKIDK